MKVASRHTYAAPPDEVFAAMTSPEVLAQKYRSLGHRDVEIVEHVDGDDGTRVRSRRRVPMDVPGFAKRFLKPLNTVEQTDVWTPPTKRGERHGTWTVSASGVPVSVGGTLHLAPVRGGATLVEIEGEVTCSLPLVGGRLASFVGGDVERTMHAEEAFNDAHLSGPAAR
jgi:hypothetical protein